MEALGAPAEAKTEMAGSHFLLSVPVSVAPSEAEERYVDNTSPEMTIVEPHSNVFDDRPNTNDSLDGLIPTDITKEAPVENLGSGHRSHVGWMIYSGDTQRRCLCP